MSRTTKWLLAGAAVRATWGLILTVTPRQVLALNRAPAPDHAVAVARTLGVRQLVQAGLTIAAPNRTVAGCGAVVDALHAGTDLGLAVGSAQWRRVALADTLIAAALAASGWLCYAAEKR